MLSWAAVACLLGGASASASASASSTSLEGALRVELDRSLSRYTALETLADVERWTPDVSARNCHQIIPCFGKKERVEEQIVYCFFLLRKSPNPRDEIGRKCSRTQRASC